MKKALLFCCILLLLAALLLPIGAEPVAVLDTENLLSYDEESVLRDLFSGEANMGVSLHLYTLHCSGAYDYPTDGAVFEACGLAEKEAAIVLVVRKAHNAYYYDIYLYGEADDIFSNADVDRVLDDPDVYDNLKAGNTAKGAAAFFPLAKDVVDTHRIREAERIARKPLTVAVTGIVVAVIAAGVAVLIVMLLYRTKKHGESYPLSHYAKLRLTRNEDRFVGSHVTRVRIQNSSSGGGGRSGGGGGRRGGR